MQFAPHHPRLLAHRDGVLDGRHVRPDLPTPRPDPDGALERREERDIASGVAVRGTLQAAAGGARRALHGHVPRPREAGATTQRRGRLGHRRPRRPQHRHVRGRGVPLRPDAQGQQPGDVHRRQRRTAAVVDQRGALQTGCGGQGAAPHPRHPAARHAGPTTADGQDQVSNHR